MVVAKWILVAAVALATAGADPESDVLDRIGSPRLESAVATGEAVVVEARAADGEAEGARSLWYGTVAAAALAQRTGSKAVTRRVRDAAGAVLSEETDAFAGGGPGAFAPLDRSAADLLQSARARARSAGARLLSAHYVRLYGGTAELVVQPDDPESFLRSAGANVATVLGDVARDHRPYLVTVVDGSGRPLLVLGYTPAVGGGTGQGIGWQAPDASSDAIWGAIPAARR
jgi:hypothetical protein